MGDVIDFPQPAGEDGFDMHYCSECESENFTWARHAEHTELMVMQCAVCYTAYPMFGAYITDVDVIQKLFEEE